MLETAHGLQPKNVVIAISYSSFWLASKLIERRSTPRNYTVRGKAPFEV